jgi:membrane protease YdiL (CAAX protease family)
LSLSTPRASLKSAGLTAGALSFVLLLLALWLEIRTHPSIGAGLGPALPFAFFSGGLLLAPLWFFGFGAAEWLRQRLTSSWPRILLPSLLGLSYLVFAIPAGIFYWRACVVMFALPVILAAFLELPKLGPAMNWRDGAALALLAAIYMLHGITGAWPYAELAALPKLFLLDIAIYLLLVIRGLDGVGYSLVPSLRALVTGAREWLFFAPFGIGLGLALGFIHFYPRWPSAAVAITSVFVTFLFIAVPEELFFRGILQNLLESRLGQRGALLLTALLFGLSHFNKGARFNWRYVLLATIAGIFYGRAWRERRQLLAAIVTHTAVDVAWSLWFR